jgi:hypothetical protein
MSAMRTLTGLSVDRVIQARVRAVNADGSGDWSEINTSGATIETLPLVMSQPTFNPIGSSNTQITIDWT